METISEYQPLIAPVGVTTLPEDRTQWPREADTARTSLVRELNRWSRDNDWPSTLNSWIAEEAVRRGY